VNGWTAVLLATDLAGTATAVVWTLRTTSGDRVRREVYLAQAALSGVLVALVALVAPMMGAGATVTFLGTSLMAGFGVRFAVLFANIDSGAGLRMRAVAGTGFLCLVVVAAVITAAVDHYSQPKSAAQRDTSRFGVHVFDEDDAVSTLVLAHRPVLADANVPAGIAVPVQRYALDGDQLTLIVWHDITCVPAIVLLAADDGAVDVAVVYKPGAITPTRSPPGSPATACLPAASGVLAVYTAIPVVLGPDLPAASVRDVGAEGPALAVSPTPSQ
jgi:hypothetical protein